MSCRVLLQGQELCVQSIADCESCVCHRGVRLLFVSQLYELYDLVEMRVDRVVMYDSCHLL